MVIAGVALGRSESLPGRAPWAIVIIGGGASLLLIGFMALYLRGLDATAGAEPPAGEQLRRLLSIPAALSLTALPSVAPLRMTRLRCDYQNTLSY